MHYLHTFRTPICTSLDKRPIYSTFKSFLEFQKRYLKSTSKVNDPDGNERSKKATKIVLSPVYAPPARAVNSIIDKNKKTSLWDGVPGSEKLITVTDHNIDEIFIKYNSILIMFYGSWCSVCKDVNIEIAKAANMITTKEGALGICDAMNNIKLVDKFLIRKTPSIKYFKNGQYVADYIGKPMAEDIIMFMQNPPKQSADITNSKSITNIDADADKHEDFANSKLKKRK